MKSIDRVLALKMFTLEHFYTLTADKKKKEKVAN